MANKTKRRGKGEGTLFKRTRMRKDGSAYVVWAAEVTVGYDDKGRQVRKTMYGKTQAEVLEKVGKLKAQLSAGAFSATRLTVTEYLQQWLDFKQLEVKPRTYQFYSDCIRRYITPYLGRIKLSKLNALHIRSMVKEVATKVSPDAANKARSLLLGALRQAVRLSLIPRNPAEAVDKLKHEVKEMTLWTPAQALHFLEVAKSHRLFAAFYLALSTGMRHGEILGLRWRDIEGDVITVRQSVINVKSAQYQISTPKTRKGVRQIVIGPDTLTVLAAHKERQEAERAYLGEAWTDSGLVFTNELGDILEPRNFDRVWYDLLRKSELPRIRFHDLRHFHVSLLIQRGLDPRTVADRVGHTDPAFTLKRYSHMFEAQRRAAGISLLGLLEAESEEDEEESSKEGGEGAPEGEET